VARALEIELERLNTDDSYFKSLPTLMKSKRDYMEPAEGPNRPKAPKAFIHVNEIYTKTISFLFFTLSLFLYA